MQQSPMNHKLGTSSLAEKPAQPIQIEQALNEAISAGIKTIPEQIHLILAYSQTLTTDATETTFDAPYSEKPLTTAQARLTAVRSLIPPSPEQAKNLARAARQSTDAAFRLKTLLALLPSLPKPEQVATFREVWESVATIDDAVARARLYIGLADAAMFTALEDAQAHSLPEIVQLATQINGVDSRVRSMVALSLRLPEAYANQVLAHIFDDINSTPNDGLRASTICALAPQLPPKFASNILTSAEKIRSPGERARAYTALVQSMPTHPDVPLLALKAIAEIVNEDERVEALMTFSPSLEEASQEKGYPYALEEALRVAVGLSRRPLRAKALVALAPHLTLDLQGEALAAVHSLSNEHDRATLLAELAPTLPPEMLVASLAVAHTMREQDARVHALNVLAHYIPVQARSQTILDALAAASNLPHHYERVQALVALLDVLPETLQEQAFTNALETTRLIENENARARALSLLSQHLPAQLLERALDLAYQIQDPQQRLNTLASLSTRAPEAAQQQALQMMLECAAAMPFEYRRARALVSITQHLTPDLIAPVLEMIDTLHDPFDKANSYIALAQNLPPEQRPQVMGKAWALLRKIEDGYDRASALIAITPFLPPPARPELRKMARSVIDSIQDEYDKASALSILVPLLTDDETDAPPPVALPTPDILLLHALKTALDIPNQAMRAQLLTECVPLWTRLDPQICYYLWRQYAQRLKTLPLADVLLSLSIIVPVIRVMGGDDALTKIRQLLSTQRGNRSFKAGGESL